MGGKEERDRERVREGEGEGEGQRERERERKKNDSMCVKYALCVLGEVRSGDFVEPA